MRSFYYEACNHFMPIFMAGHKNSRRQTEEISEEKVDGTQLDDASEEASDLWLNSLVTIYATLRNENNLRRNEEKLVNGCPINISFSSVFAGGNHEIFTIIASVKVWSLMLFMVQLNCVSRGNWVTWLIVLSILTTSGENDRFYGDVTTF